MKVKCIETYHNIEIGQEYTVYAMTIYKGLVCYAIREIDSYCFVDFKKSSLFEITDNRLSRFWVFEQKNVDDEIYSVWAFPEWANDIYYLSNSIEGGKKENELLSAYMELMDLEFPNPEILEMAQIGNNEWLICPTCIDAWESSSTLALVICPKCNRLRNNPRYPWVKEPKNGKVTTFLPTNEIESKNESKRIENEN